MRSRVRFLFHPTCHYQIIHDKFNLKNVTPDQLIRKFGTTQDYILIIVAKQLMNLLDRGILKIET